MTLQLLHSEFPYIWGKFDYLFLSVHSATKLLKSLYPSVHTCPLSWSVHCNFVRDTYSERGGRAAPVLTANFSIMMERTPKSGRCHSLYSVINPAAEEQGCVSWPIFLFIHSLVSRTGAFFRCSVYLISFRMAWSSLLELQAGGRLTVPQGVAV